MVLYPYEFTLLSNTNGYSELQSTVLYPYEFTLLSNIGVNGIYRREFYIPMNLHYSQTT